MATVLELTTPVQATGTGDVDLKNSTTFTINGVEGDKSQISYTRSATVLFYVRDTVGDSWETHTIDVDDGSGDNAISIIDKNGEEVSVITVTIGDGKNWQKFEVTLEADYKIKFGSGPYSNEKRLFIVKKSQEETFDASHLGTENPDVPEYNENNDVLFSMTESWRYPIDLDNQTKTAAELMPTLNISPVTIDNGVFNVTQEMLDANDVISFTATYGELSKSGSIETPDTIAPVITLNGSSSVTIGSNSDEGASYTDPGASAHDARDGDISSSITTTGSVDISVVGTYTITYDVSDTAGNQATPVERTVNVLHLELTTPVEFKGTEPGTVDLKNFTTFTIGGEEGDKSQISYTYTRSATVLFYVRDTYGDGWNGHTIDVDDGSDNNAIKIIDKNGEEVSVITVADADNLVWQKFEVTLEADYLIKFGSGTYQNEIRLFIVNKSQEETFDASHLGTENTMPSANDVLFMTSTWKHNYSNLTNQTKTPAELMPTLNLNPVTIDNGVFNVTQEMLDANDVISFTATYGELSKSGSIEAIYSETPNVEITLNGNETMTLNVGDSFSDPGATTDADGVTATVTGSVDTSVVGTYTLTYSAAGATQDKVRTVTVLPTVQDVSTHTVKNQPTSFFLKYNGP